MTVLFILWLDLAFSEVGRNDKPQRLKCFHGTSYEICLYCYSRRDQMIQLHLCKAITFDFFLLHPLLSAIPVLIC